MAVARLNGELLHRRRPGFLQVVAADVHRVPQRDPLGAEGDHVDDQALRGLRREDVGAAAQVLLDDVVLGRAAEAAALDALVLGVRDVETEQPCGGRIDGHRRVHVADRYAVEELAHVAEMCDRHPYLADLAARMRVVGVVAGLGRQIERDRQARLALREVGAVELVRGAGGRVSRVRAHHPRPVRHAVHASAGSDHRLQGSTSSITASAR